MEKINGHLGVVAPTQAGKSYLVKSMIKKCKKEVIIINTKHEKIIGAKRSFDELDDMEHLMALLKQYKVVDLFIDYEYRHEEVGYLIKQLFDYGFKGIVYFDEMLAFKVSKCESIGRLSETGLSLGMWLWWSSQSLAKVDSDVERNTRQKVFLYGLDNMEIEHLRGKKYPIDEILNKLKLKYQYVIKDGNDVSVAKKA